MGKCTYVPSDAVIVAASAKYTNTRGLGVVQSVSKNLFWETFIGNNITKHTIH